jgi:enoyl-[acyl-carrier-protein] reductase (NADH)
MLPLDVEQPGRWKRVFDAIRERWGRLDFLLHSIAFAPPRDLHGRVADSSREGFAARDGHLVPLVHAHGAARRAADGPRRRRCSP